VDVVISSPNVHAGWLRVRPVTPKNKITTRATMLV